MNILDLTRRAISGVLSPGREESHVVDYSDAGLIQNLTDSFSEVLLGKIEATGHSPCTSEVEAVLDHFCSRTSPVLFHHPAVVASLFVSVRETNPEWISRTLDRVSGERNDSLLIYAQPGPPLTAPYPWAGPESPPGGDVQYRKRPHRFAFLPRMALASAYDAEVRDWMLEIILDWMRFVEKTDNELPFDSNLAVIQRLMAFSWAWIYLRGTVVENKTADLELNLLKVIAEDVKYLIPRLGKSFANNHLLADLFASWYIAAVFPEFDSRDCDRQILAENWFRELERQTTSDGWSFEHCSHYHEFACDMALAYLLLSRANGWSVLPGSEELLKLMLKVQSHLSSDSGLAIQIGDCTEENIFPLGVHEGHGPGLYRESYRALFDPAVAAVDPKQPAVEAAFWLLGGLREPVGCDYPHSGLSLYNHQPGGLVFQRDEELETELLFRTGPGVDAPVSSGHVHSDWLALYLRRRGIPVITDAGTYSYRSNVRKWAPGEPSWRHYLRGPEAHNCAVLRDLDPVGDMPHADFRHKKGTSRVVTHIRAHNARCSWVEGHYNGVEAFSGYRRAVLQLAGLYSLVVDIHPSNSQLDWIGFQFAPGVSVSRKGSGLTASCGDRDMVSLFSCQAAAEIELLKGSIDPLGGWVSPRYGELEPAWQARVKFSDRPDFSAMLLACDDVDWSVTSTNIKSDIYCLKLVSGQCCDYLFLRGPGQLDCIETDYFVSDAELLWMRREGGSLIEMFAVNASFLSLPEGASASFDAREDLVELERSESGGKLKVVPTQSAFPS